MKVETCEWAEGLIYETCTLWFLPGLACSVYGSHL